MYNQKIKIMAEINLFKEEQIDLSRDTSALMTKVYGWMTLALSITGIIAFLVAMTSTLAITIATNKILFYGMIIAELGCVIYLSARIHKMSFSTALLVFLAYSVLNGLTLSVIFFAYTATSLASTFFITSGTFGIMSLYGYTTKKDLSGIGQIAIMALVGLIIASIVNFFMPSSTLNLIISYAGVLIFIALTAYDTQKIKMMSYQVEAGSEAEKKVGIMGALTLYLDFINLFLFILRILGDRR